MKPSANFPGWHKTFNGFDDFLRWEVVSQDVIAFRTIYADMAGDVLAGLLLSQIVYWHLPSKKGEQKLRVFKRGKWWIARDRTEWWDEIRLTVKQIDRAIAVLKRQGLIETINAMFKGKRVQHIHLIGDRFMELWQELTKERTAMMIFYSLSYPSAKRILKTNGNSLYDKAK